MTNQYTELVPVRVWFIDEEPMRLALLKPILASFDQFIIIDTLSDSRKALEVISKIKYDCIIVDQFMPRIDGLGLIHMNKEKQYLPSILYTGMGTDEIEAAAQDVGVDGYIQKILNPSDYNEFACLIRRTIEE